MSRSEARAPTPPRTQNHHPTIGRCAKATSQHVMSRTISFRPKNTINSRVFYVGFMQHVRMMVTSNKTRRQNQLELTRSGTHAKRAVAQCAFQVDSNASADPAA